MCRDNANFGAVAFDGVLTDAKEEGQQRIAVYVLFILLIEGKISVLC